METPSFREAHISQIPALLMLIKLGYIYISPEQAMQQRGGRTSNVLLENILFNKLKELNSISFKGNEYEFSEANVLSAIQAIKNLPIQEGYINANQELYNLITLGKSFEQTIGGDKKSFQFKYIDWEKPENNIFHVTEEFSVKRTGSNKEYRPDIVLFVNGIPFVVIESKSPSLSGTTKPVDLATEQHLRNQENDGIRDLYQYSQLILSLAVNENRYGTTGTDKDFFGEWKERFQSKEEENKYKNNIKSVKTLTATSQQTKHLFAERFFYVKKYFQQLETEQQSITPQDEILYSLCTPDRLLELVYHFIVYDNGVKKIARYQQYFAVKKTILRVRPLIAGKRNGGVIWHTQGSGKSLTMVMLAQLLAMDSYILNPQIVIVTDRIDLDDQILGTFQKCGKKVKQADKGASLLIRKYLKGKKLTDNENNQLQNDTSLLKLLLLDKDIVITTVINKFEAAVKELKNNSSFIEKNTILNSPDIFVLVDEGHRSQYGSFNVQMQKALPNACFIAFTGTPLMKKEKNTATRFGGEIDRYTITQAVEDKAVVPLLFEGRHVLQEVNSKALDTFFDNVSEPLNQYQRGELKRKFNRADQLNKADQKIYTIAWDIAKYYYNNWKNTGFKAQLVTPDKNTAIKYKEYLDETGLVTSEVVFSPPDTREGTETAYSKPSDRVLKFWNAMIDKHGNSKKYADNIINAFKKREEPEIIIVVDKLLTGFDAPQNRVLFITRNLREHTLLQAIARVNRVYPGKDNGIIIDYYG
ncbi:MAG: type I restriction endonuclease subunit R, partial [Bacteroidales bacterium]|nr:type I restriction endonuclease subunit R [Bacteroidales bacterium]